MEPDQATEVMAVVMIPWGTKIIYGLICDNISICGTKRKSYIVIMGLLQFLCCNVLFVYSNMDIIAITAMITIISFSEAFTNVVSDALLVI